MQRRTTAARTGHLPKALEDDQVKPTDKKVAKKLDRAKAKAEKATQKAIDKATGSRNSSTRAGPGRPAYGTEAPVARVAFRRTLEEAAGAPAPQARREPWRRASPSTSDTR